MRADRVESGEQTFGEQAGLMLRKRLAVNEDVVEAGNAPTQKGQKERRDKHDAMNIPDVGENNGIFDLLDGGLRPRDALARDNDVGIRVSADGHA